MPISIPAISDRLFSGEGRGLAVQPVRQEQWVPAFAGTRSSANERGFSSSRRSAEHGFTLSRRSAEHGFTLIELMVVITIIALLSAAVLLTSADPRGRVVDDAERFAARVMAARDNALLQSRPMSIWVAPGGYGFEQRTAGRWVAMNDKPFAATNWKPGTLAQLGSEERAVVRFDSTGAATDPLTVTLARDGERVSVSVDVSGKVSVIG